MTIIVGIVCKTGIVLTSDSQTSFSPGSSKRSDTDKIAGVLFKSGERALVAQAGNAELSCRAVEILRNTALQSAFDDYRKPADIAQEAVRSLKEELIRLNLWETNREFAHEYFEHPDNNFSLMLAYYHGQPPQPYLYTLNFWPGIATRQYRYATMGCGATVADFILNRAYTSNMEMHHGWITAIYTVEEVKKVDCFCGGPTKIGFINEDGTAKLSKTQRSLDLVTFTAEAMAKHDEQIKQQWKEMMIPIINEANERFRTKYPNPEQEDQNE